MREKISTCCFGAFIAIIVLLCYMAAIGFVLLPLFEPRVELIPCSLFGILMLLMMTSQLTAIGN